jgi:hypothetical protein
MRTTWRMLAVVIPIALVAACTDAAKAPAEAAMAAAGTAMDTLKGEATKFAPEAVKSVEATYNSAKDAIAKQDYKGALAAAQGIPAAAKEALAKAAANKQKLLDAWNEAGGSVTKLLEAAKSRLDILSQAKKLPAGLDKAGLEKAQGSYASIQSGLASAAEQAKSGDFVGAVTKAAALKAQGLELLKSIGLQ